METFVDAVTRKPVSQIDISVGQTKIVGLKKFNLTNPPHVPVLVRTGMPEIAFSFQVSRLRDTSKKAYDRRDPPRLSEFYDQLVSIERDGFIFFQICGRAAGQVELIAYHDTPPYTAYAQPVPVSVKPDQKRLQLPGAPSFDMLWRNHPLNPANPGGAVSYPCTGGPDGPLKRMQCMVRLCTALERSGVSLAGMRGFTWCRSPGTDHANHFSDPYEFERWSVAAGQFHEWKASALAPEPMPGLAALWFVMDRQGIIMFQNYFDVSGRDPMFGGHIDLWNKRTMGNTYTWGDRSLEGQSAFLRSRRICFWPLD